MTCADPTKTEKPAAADRTSRRERLSFFIEPRGARPWQSNMVVSIVDGLDAETQTLSLTGYERDLHNSGGDVHPEPHEIASEQAVQELSLLLVRHEYRGRGPITKKSGRGVAARL